MGADENPVVAGCLELAEAMGFEAWRNNAAHVPGRRFNGKKGRGDILGVSPSARTLTCECKKPGGTATKEQIEFADLVHSRGGYGCIVMSVEEFVAYLVPRMKELGEWKGIPKISKAAYNEEIRKPGAKRER
jgi:hypothetical protein